QTKIQLISSKEQLWPQFYNGEVVKKQVEVLETNISPEERNLFVKDAISHINSARKPSIMIGVLDGIEYYFIFNDSGKIKIAFKNASADDGSIIGNMIRRLNTTIKY
ncbi:MAG: hypothetical protein AAGJ93_14335, partial [Bacteroidota bacterium]